MNEQRIRTVRSNLAEMGLKQALFCDPTSIWYLTGYTTEPYERFFGLLVTADRTVLFCNNLFPDATGHADKVVTFNDTDDPVPLVAAELDAAALLGVDKDLTARWLLPLMDAGAAAGCKLASKAVDDARSSKDEEEKDLMRRASAINDQAMAWLAAQVKVGVTEHSIAERLLGEYRSHMVLFDVGCKYHRYCSDMTRTFFTAEPTERQLLVYNTVKQANEAAEAIVRPGVTFAQIDLTARHIIEEAGFGQYFTHRLGHQIGLVDHEPGDVSSTHDEPVREGQIFSIEPGIYIPGEIGVRIEDLLIVTADGCEVLNSYPHDATVLPLA